MPCKVIQLSLAVHLQELKQFIVLVMELCEYDLDHLVKVQPFKEDDITLFLYQLGESCDLRQRSCDLHTPM